MDLLPDVIPWLLFSVSAAGAASSCSGSFRCPCRARYPRCLCLFTSCIMVLLSYTSLSITTPSLCLSWAPSSFRLSSAFGCSRAGAPARCAFLPRCRAALFRYTSSALCVSHPVLPNRGVCLCNCRMPVSLRACRLCERAVAASALSVRVLRRVSNRAAPRTILSSIPCHAPVCKSSVICVCILIIIRAA